MNTYHPRITNATTSGFAGPQRTPELKAMLQTEQQVARSSPADSYNEHVAAANVADLEGLIALSEKNDRAREEGAAERAAASEAKRQARQAADDAALKDRLRIQFLGQPGAREQDFERLYPRLRDEHLMRQSGEAMAQARSRLGRI